MCIKSTVRVCDGIYPVKQQFPKIKKSPLFLSLLFYKMNERMSERYSFLRINLKCFDEAK